MRVLHVTSGNMYGGVETFLATLARESAAVPEMHSEFLVCFEGRCSRELSSLGPEPYVVGNVRLSRPHTVFRARRAMARVLRGASYDVVVCHQPWSYVVFGRIARRAGLPVVLWVHMATSGTHWIERLARRSTPDLAICGSRFSAASLCQWFSGASIELVYCPVSQPDFSGAPKSRQRIRRDLGIADDEVVIVQVSRLDALKGHRVLVQALAQLRGVRGWRCWIVGGAYHAGELAYLRELEIAAKESGISDRVTFLGERTDVSEILTAADVFCQPNTAPDAFGLSLVEALQAGLPVVTSAIGGACEIVDAACGMLTEPGDSIALAEALKRLVADAALRGRLGDAARQRPAALCDAPRQMRRIYQVLSSVAAA